MTILNFVNGFRFRNQQDNRANGLSTAARTRRKRRNLVSTQFNMINWMLELLSLLPVIFQEKQIFTILYLLVTSCGTPLVYYLGIEDNRQKAKEYFQSRMRILKKEEAAHVNIIQK